jgi:GntR family transcriptional regulator
MDEDRSVLELSDVASLHKGTMPRYHSLGQVIRARIQSGEWQVGQRIPSERELMRLYGISRSTVRQSIENLVREGILERAQGKGTFVAPPKIKQGLLRLRDFADTMQRSGLEPAARLLAKGVFSPPTDVQQSLGLDSSQEVFWCQRLWLVNDFPMMIETLYLPVDRFPDVAEKYQECESLERFIEQHYSVRIIREDEVFEPVIMDRAEAELLGAKSGSPALWVEVVARDAALAPVMVRTDLLRGDRCRFYVDLTSE